jgi:hypothetical protein
MDNEKLQELLKLPPQDPFEDVRPHQSQLEPNDSQDLRVKLRDFSHNKEVMHISSKLAQSVQGVQTFLREKTFSIKPQDDVEPVTISGANPLVERLAKGLMRRTRDKRADRYKDYIDDLVSQIDLQKEVYERSPSRMAEKKKVLARLRYASQQAELPDIQDLENLSGQFPELSASPSRRYTQELSFHYDRQSIEGDPHFAIANENRKRR